MAARQPSQTALRLATALLAAAALPGCGQRHVAYHFRAPLVRSVNADLRLRRPLDADLDGEATWRTRSARAPDHRRGAGTTSPKPEVFTIPAEPLRAAGADGAHLAAILRDQVGRRDEDATHVQFVFTALRAIGVRPDPALAAADDGPAVRDLASERGALIPAGEAGTTARPHLGDLVLFDRVTDDHPASLLAIVVSTDARDVVEFVYLARGVVRRGYLSRSHPHDKRDPDGRVLNTFLRHSDGELPRGAPALAGELHAATIHLARLLR